MFTAFWLGVLIAFFPTVLSCIVRGPTFLTFLINFWIIWPGNVDHIAVAWTILSVFVVVVRRRNRAPVTHVTIYNSEPRITSTSNKFTKVNVDSRRERELIR